MCKEEIEQGWVRMVFSVGNTWVHKFTWNSRKTLEKNVEEINGEDEVLSKAEEWQIE